MIEARNLSKAFGQRHAVDSVSFEVARGTVVGFLGPNGAGKSTTMRLLTGYLPPDGGSAHIAGYDIGTETARARACLGYLPEAAAGFPHLTVRELLVYCAECRGLWGTARDGAIDRVSEEIELGPALDQKMRTLSKGWRQRAWFAQAILHDPPVLIFDEPTDGLDPNQKAHVRALIRSIAPRKAIILSTHILEEAEEICDRVIIIAKGRIVADDAREALSDGKGRLWPAFERLTASDAAVPAG
ncbi:MAG: ABC transporter ATP-binding protein [Hyphomicrobiales bacterium]|nr:ABC transporter ATP-binding protein [Hyphomicrobiales bacterium]